MTLPLYSLLLIAGMPDWTIQYFTLFLCISFFVHGCWRFGFFQAARLWTLDGGIPKLKQMASWRNVEDQVWFRSNPVCWKDASLDETVSFFRIADRFKGAIKLWLMLQPQRNITEERSNWPHLPGLNMLGNCTTRPQKNKPAAKYELWSRNAWRWTFIKIGMREAVWISSYLTVQRVFDFQLENMPRNFSHSKCNVWFDKRILLSTSKWAIFESTFHANG